MDNIILLKLNALKLTFLLTFCVLKSFSLEKPAYALSNNTLKGHILD